MAMASPLSLPELTDDLTAEILLRVGPYEPARLFRTSLVCKLWHRLLSDPAFHRRYIAFHRCPTLLGFFYNLGFSRFVAAPATPAAAALALPLRSFDDRRRRRRRVPWAALDCRHGRVLFKKTSSSGCRDLAVWDPIADVWTDLPPQPQLPPWGLCFESYSGVVLCDVAGCDHRDCSGGGRFLVVCIGRDRDFVVSACVYSSEDHAWTETCSDGTRCSSFSRKRPAVIGDGVYCSVNLGYHVLRYDLVESSFSWIKMPCKYKRDPVFMQNEDGSLGVAAVKGSSLYLWSRRWNNNAEGGVAGYWSWIQRRVIRLRKILPVDDGSAMKAHVIGFAEGVGVFFIRTNVGVFMLELNSGQVMKVSGPTNGHWTVFPFITSFNTVPDRASRVAIGCVEMN